MPLRICPAGHVEYWPEVSQAGNYLCSQIQAVPGSICHRQSVELTSEQETAYRLGGVRAVLEMLPIDAFNWQPHARVIRRD